MIGPLVIRLSVFQADPSGPPIDFYGQADVNEDVSSDTRLPSNLTRSAQNKWILIPADQMKTDRLSIFIHSPHREQQGSLPPSRDLHLLWLYYQTRPRI